MRDRHLAAVLAVLLVVPVGEGVAQFAIAETATFVDHPVTNPAATRTAGQWRRGTGAWGETMAREGMRARGYNDIRTPKLRGDQGIDLIAIRRGARGVIQDVRLVEVKTHRGGVPAMGRTAKGRQMSRQWLAAKFSSMRVSSDPAQRALAAEISKFRRSHRLSPELLGEIHDINTRTGTYTLRDPVNGQVGSQRPIDQALRRLQYSGVPATQTWAGFHRDRSDRIRTTNMSGWLGRPRQSDAPADRFGRRLVRVAGPAGAVIAYAVDAGELYAARQAYVVNNISRRQYRRVQARVGGGFVGAGVGTMAGAYWGATVSAMGGPFAWVTLPTGVLIGAGVGGMSGYFAGSGSATRAVDSWYDRLEESTRNQVDDWIITTAFDAIASSSIEASGRR